MNKYESKDWLGKASGFVSVVALTLMGAIYGTLIIGIITVASIGFIMKSLWFHRQRPDGTAGWKTTIIEGDYQLLEETSRQRGDHEAP